MKLNIKYSNLTSHMCSRVYLTVCLNCRSQQTCSAYGQIVSTVGLAGHTVFIESALLLYHGSSHRPHVDG